MSAVFIRVPEGYAERAIPASKGFGLETAMEIAAEDADYAENADEEGLRLQAMRLGRIHPMG